MDMADKYPPAEHFDRDTLPPSDWEEDTLPSMRNPLQEEKGPNWGAIGGLVFCLLVWGSVFFFACR